MPNNETTTKFKVDISQLKKEMQEAARSIRLANSEFKATTSSMDDWGHTADGLSAKVKQMETVLGAQNKQLKSLEAQYAAVAEEQGENSKGAQELMIRINNQKAAIGKTERELNGYKQRLNDVENATEDMADSTQEVVSASDKLKNAIDLQENELSQLKKAYSDLALEQGENSAEARQLKNQISMLSSELKSNKEKLSQAEQAADSFDSSLNNLEDGADGAGDGFTVMKGAIADLVADGIRMAIDAMKQLATESDRAYNSFQTQTGASAQEMSKFKEQINDLYLKGYEEDLQGVADAMAKVKQFTGEVDPTKLKELTENALVFSETFEADFNESLRGADALMRNMGLSAEEAFDIMAKGTQRGLDKSGELGDNIAEYSQLWAQAGFSAEEMFAILENGLDSGAYNLDKVNDFVKEFSISLSDGRIEKNISSFSEETQGLFKSWKEGKATSKDVFHSVINDLDNATNEQEALTIASTVWSALGEDNAMKVIRSLNDTNDAYKDVSGTMDEIKETRFDDIANQWKVLGRTAKQELLAPLMKEILPGVKKFITYCIDNFDELLPIIEGVGAALITAFAVKKVFDFINAIKALTLVVNANPIGLLVTAMAGLTAGVAAYEAANKKAIEKQYGLTEAQKESISKVNEMHEAYETMNEARNETMGNISAEYGYLTTLKNELNGLIDSNHQVKAGYEDRANFIINELSNALGIEKEKLWEIINTNGQLGESIDKIIEKKRAEALLSANEDAYIEAKQKQTDALKQYQTALQTVEETEKKYNDTKAKADEVMENYYALLEMAPENAAYYLAANRDIIQASEEAEDAYKKAKSSLSDAEETYVGYNATIQNYEGLSSAIISGDSEKIATAMMNIENSFITAENGTKSSLERQVENMEKNYDSLKKAVETGTPGVTQEMVNSAKTMVDNANTELAKFEEKAGESTGKAGDSAAKGFSSKIPDLATVAKYGALAFMEGFNAEDASFYETGETAGSNVESGLSGTKSALDATGKLLSDSVNENLGSSDTKSTGSKKGTEYDLGLQSTKEKIGMTSTGISTTMDLNLGAANTMGTGSKKGNEFNSGLGSISGAIRGTGSRLSSDANNGMQSANTGGTGVQKGTEFNSGLGSVSTYSTGRGRANDAKEGMASVDSYSTGNNFTGGFVRGISSGSWASSLWDAAWGIGKKALNALSAAIKEGSPSKLTEKSGNFFGIGFVNGIADQMRNAVLMARDLGKETIASLNDSLESEQATLNISAGKKRLTENIPRTFAANGHSGDRLSGGSGGVTNNFYYTQNNTSPKALSRLDIYRQTKSQLFAAKGRFNHV